MRVYPGWYRVETTGIRDVSTGILEDARTAEPVDHQPARTEGRLEAPALWEVIDHRSPITRDS